MIEDGVVEDSLRLGPHRHAIERAALESRVYLYTPSVLDAAAATLSAVRGVLDEHHIADTFQFQAYGDAFAARVLGACEQRFTAEWQDLEGDVDPVALLDVAVTAAGEHLGRRPEPVQGPALAPEGRAVFGYVVLARHDESPDWGPGGDAPLVLSLGRPDMHMLAVAYSSGAGWDGPYDPGPWRWYLGHEVPRDVCITETTVIAPAPAPAVAAEVGAITARVLTGDLPLPR
ncbi:hypothetical protein [Actinomadura xylanilytica]|uniref:hypothetical protein n=1 Tax=Actinomadura xylanilytica TaxID=887459 RepID=UPI00255B3A92|nr:hypothetical protein [Actinomadura xylanilytica]MDL4777581.1 hypothetical protein [Actinomadura xylanilytica]